MFIGNRIENVELVEAYATIDHEGYYRETAEASGVKFEAAAREIADSILSQATILDIGGGDGAFLRKLKAQGFQHLSLHEIPGGDLPELSDVVSTIYRDMNYESLPAAAFDVITMMDVMEHVVDPAATFAAARRALRQGGILYVHTPTVTVLDRLMQLVQRTPWIGGIGRVWQRTRTSIFHLQIYTPQALRLLAARHGFTVTRLVTINELSWPVERYVRVYLVDKAGLPAALGPLVATLLRPLLCSRMNANKLVLVARG